MKSIKALLLEAPHTQIDHSIFPLIEKWDETPTALQVLEVLDMAVHIGGASPFAMTTFNLLLKTAIEDENTTYEAVVARATWRNRE